MTFVGTTMTSDTQPRRRNHRSGATIKKNQKQKFVFTNKPLLPTHPHLEANILHFTPQMWRAWCWRQSPPTCAECGISFVRPDKGTSYFCGHGCYQRWNDRLSNLWVPVKYRNVQWEGRKEGLLPEELRWIREIWNKDRDKNAKSRLANVCGAQCSGHPTNEFPLARDRRGEPCQMPAGWGTQHPGSGTCRFHGGLSPNSNKRAARLRAEEMKIVSQKIYGEPVADLTPEEAILQELQRTAGHVQWLFEKVQEVGAETDEDGNYKGENKALIQYTKLGITPSVWISMYQEERKHLMAVAKTASSMGIAERQVRLAEEQGRMLAAVIQAFMSDPDLGLTNAQKARAPELIRRHLAAIPLRTPARPGEAIVETNGMTAATNREIRELEEPDSHLDPIDLEEG